MLATNAKAVKARAVETIQRPRAEQRVRFIDQYRSYVINYNLGKDMARRYIESRGGTGAGRAIDASAAPAACFLRF